MRPAEQETQGWFLSGVHPCDTTSEDCVYQDGQVCERAGAFGEVRGEGPVCGAALREERGIVKIKLNPWPRIQIPWPDKAEKLAILPEECRDFFNAPLPETKMLSPLPELGRDVAMMVLCLGGINAVDLFNMKKDDYYNGILHYKRAKTKKFRADEAYMEMKVHPILRSIFEKYGAYGADGANGYDRITGKCFLFASYVAFWGKIHVRP